MTNKHALRVYFYVEINKKYVNIFLMERKEFEDVVLKLIKKRLDDNKIKFNNTNLNIIQIDFEKENFDLIIEKYLKIKRKYFLINKSMNTVYSKELKRKRWCFTKNQKMVLNEIEDKLKNNVSIKPYLSNGLYLSKFSKQDDLFEKENIYHVHLGIPDKKEHFVTRTDKLLFFTYDEDNVYFLDIKKHPIGDEWNCIDAINIKKEFNINSDIDNLVFGTKENLLNKFDDIFNNEKDENIEKAINLIL